MHTNCCFRGPWLCTFHDPIPFEQFIDEFEELPAEREAPARAPPVRRPVTHDAVEAMLLAEPWLRREDLEQDVARRPPPRHPASGRPPTGPGGDDEPGSEGDLDAPGGDATDAEDEGDGHDDGDPAVDIDLEMAVVREYVGEVADGHPDLYFHIVHRGGAWTFEHTGDAVDTIRGHARHQISRSWCTLFHWPKTASFAITKYSLADATLFAREYCKRSTFFLRLFLEAGSPVNFEYDPRAVDDYVPDAEWLEFVLGFADESDVMHRAHQLFALLPGIG